MEYKVSIPEEMTVLTVLRILGRGECLDTIEELSGIGKSTVQRSFKTWTHNFAKLKSHFIRIPEGQELVKVMEVYNKLGLTGAVGSIDCTHLKWDRCPNINRNNYIGKEGFPSIAYEVIVDHNRYYNNLLIIYHKCYIFRKILFVTKGFPGSYNDKTICQYDAFVHGLRTRTLYEDIEYEIEVNDGTLRKVKQVFYLLLILLLLLLLLCTIVLIRYI